MTRRQSSTKLTRRRRYLLRAARKTLWVLVTAAVVAGLVAADRLGVFGRAPLPDTEKYDGKTFLVVNVVDGDTLDVGVPDGKFGRTRIRLWGVDTPETVKPNTPPQHFGLEASEFVKRTCQDETVTLRLEPRQTRDKHNRLLAYVILSDGRMLNRALIEAGYGYADLRFRHKHMTEFKRLQREAKQARRGLWKNPTNSDLPYYYRDKLKLPRR